MSREVMADCIQFAREQQVQTIDITGGAPEMNPDFEWLVTEACKVCSHVIVRTNLTVLLNPEYEHLIEFYARQKVYVPCLIIGQIRWIEYGEPVHLTGQYRYYRN